MKRDHRAYLRDYYQRNRAAIRAQQRRQYETKYVRVSQELLEHLQSHPRHALGSAEIICADCERLGPFRAVVCLECGRADLAQLSIHLREAHKLPREDYLKKWGLKRGASLASPSFRAAKARPANLPRSRPRFTSETARRVNLGRRWTAREKNKASQSPRGNPVTPQFKRKLAYWPIVSQCLKGKERKEITTRFDLWAGTVNRLCQAIGLPSRPARYWRGEPLGQRHVHDLMRDFDLSEVKLARLMGLPVHRIRRPLSQKRKGRTLQLDVANRLLKLRERLRTQTRHSGVRLTGGRPPKLTPSEAREIPWKFRVMVRELNELRKALPSTNQPLAIKVIGECLCALARREEARLLLYWGRPFLAWLKRERDLNTEALSPASTAVTEFFAAEYGVSEDTIQNLLPRRLSAAANGRDLLRRELLVDIGTVMGKQPCVVTSVLLFRLPGLRSQWRRLKHPRQLAALLGPAGVRSHQWRVGARRVRGYRREDLGIHSTEEAAREFGITLKGLKQWIRLGKIPVPPIVSRSGVRGRGNVRLWTRADIEAAKAFKSTQPRTVFRPAASVTGEEASLVVSQIDSILPS